MVKIYPSEITPESMYLSRRKFMLGLGAAAASAALSACGVGKAPSLASSTATGTPRSTPAGLAMSGTDELGDRWTPYEQVTHFNNYYEFSTSKTALARLAQNFRADPWAVRVEGLVNAVQRLR